MNLYHLKCFQVVAKENHITHAAQKLNIAQPALSANIAKLEKELDVKLFDRVGRQIVLNDCGKMLLEYVDVMLSNWDIACSKIDQYRRANRQEIKIAATGILFPQRLIRDFKIEYPDITIKQSNIMVNEIEPSLLNLKADYVISSIPVNSKETESYFLLKESLYLLVNHTHPLAARKFVHIEDLAGEPFISLPEGYAFRQTIDEWFSKAGMEHNVVFECFPSQFADLVVQGIGLAFASESTVVSNSYPPEVVPIPILPPFYRNLYILWQKDRSFNYACKRFHKYALQYDMKSFIESNGSN